jgi:Glycosyl transferases group 1
MAKSFKQIIRYRLEYPVHHALDNLRAQLSSVRTVYRRILIASDNLAPTSEEQFTPLLSHRRQLFEKLGIILDHKLLDDVLKGGKSDPELAAVLAKLTFRTHPPDALQKITHLRHQFPHPTRIIYFDGDDDACIQWGSMLEHVDLYVKKQMFADLSWYSKRFTGKNNLTDYVARHFNTQFANNEIPHSGTVPEDSLCKIVLGYNIGMDSNIAALYRESKPTSAEDKTIDLICRAACRPDLWIYPFRGPISAILDPLKKQGYQILLPDQRVSQQQYYQEMRSSRICISPFGYGELCWRDFEAILMGCMLVKPDMSHLRTQPNIFIPGETYAPVRWDLSDLREVCAFYLDNEEARASIAASAYRVLSDYISNLRFMDTFRTVLDRAGVSLPHLSIQ